MRKLILLITLGLLGCTRQICEVSDEEKKEITAELTRITNSIFELADRKDLSYNRPMSDHVTGIFSGTVMDSWKRHKKQMADFFASQQIIESTLEIIEVNVLSVTSAIVVCKYQIQATDLKGILIKSPPSCITYVYQRINGEWKVVHFHDSEKREG